MATAATPYSTILQGLQPGSMLYSIFQNAANNPGSVNPAALQMDLQDGSSTGGYTPTVSPGAIPFQPGNGLPSPSLLDGLVQSAQNPTAAPAGTQPASTGGVAPIGTRPGLLDAQRPGQRTGTQDATQLPINIPGLGNLGNLNMGAILPALFGTGLGLWNMLGSQGAYTGAGDVVNNAETAAGSQVNNTAQAAASGVKSAASTGNALLDRLLGYTQESTSPYKDAGSTAATQLNAGLQPGGALNTNLTADQMLANDPGYQFRLGQGAQGIQAKLAAEGLGDSGEALKQLSQYQQDYASNEFSNAYQRDQQNKQNLFQRLAGTAGLGLTGTGQDITGGEAFGAPQAANDINAANTAGGFNLAGSQYQGNANVTGAGAIAGGKIDANQAQQNFIQQLLSMLPALFGGGSGTGGTVGTGGLSLSDIIGPYVQGYGQTAMA
jgi:hypothetical protein